MSERCLHLRLHIDCAGASLDSLIIQYSEGTSLRCALCSMCLVESIEELYTSGSDVDCLCHYALLCL